VGEETEQLRREIEATRENISRDVDALSYKASPSRIVGDRVQSTKSRIGGVKDRVFGSASDAGSSVHGRQEAVGGRLVGEVTGAGDLDGAGAGEFTRQGAVVARRDRPVVAAPGDEDRDVGQQADPSGGVDRLAAPVDHVARGVEERLPLS
jgi:hypothetical protein